MVVLKTTKVSKSTLVKARWVKLSGSRDAYNYNNNSNSNSRFGSSLQKVK